MLAPRRRAHNRSPSTTVDDVDERRRYVKRLLGAEGPVSVAVLGGGAGTMASLGPIGMVSTRKWRSTG
jgi:hypothetical protein